MLEKTVLGKIWQISLLRGFIIRWNEELISQLNLKPDGRLVENSYSTDSSSILHLHASISEKRTNSHVPRKVWLLAVVAVLPLLYYQQVVSVAVESLVLHEVCIESWPSANAKRGYTFFILLIMYVIPILVVSVVHAKIATFLRTHTTNAQTIAAAASAETNSAAAARAQREINRNKRTTTLLSVVAVSKKKRNIFIGSILLKKFNCDEFLKHLKLCLLGKIILDAAYKKNNMLITFLLAFNVKNLKLAFLQSEKYYFVIWEIVDFDISKYIFKRFVDLERQISIFRWN